MTSWRCYTTWNPLVAYRPDYVPAAPRVGQLLAVPPALDNVEVSLDEEALRKPLRWRKPRRVFVCSMTDLFGEWVSDEMLDRVFAVMALTPHITYQVLTERPARMRGYIAAEDRVDAIGEAMTSLTGRPVSGDPPDADYDRLDDLPLPNVWLGVNVTGGKR